MKSRSRDDHAKQRASGLGTQKAARAKTLRVPSLLPELRWGHDATLGQPHARRRGTHNCNIWQGKFPEVNTQRRRFFVNGVRPQLPRPMATGDTRSAVTSGNGARTGSCPSTTATHQSATHKGPPWAEAVSCAVFLPCHGSYCNRCRVTARSSNTPFLG